MVLFSIADEHHFRMKVKNLFFVIYSGMEHYPDTDAKPAAADWTCNHCTFINRGELNSCEICNLPR